MIALLWSSVTALPALADTSDLATVLQLKVLSYDRNLKARSGKNLVIGVLYKAGASRSEKAKNEIAASFSRVTKKSTVQGLTATIVTIAFDDEATLENRINSAGANVVFLSPGLEVSATAITAITNRAQIPTLSYDRQFAQRGASIAVIAKGGSPVIVVNLRASRAAGMNLSSSLLRLADVIK